MSKITIPVADASPEQLYQFCERMGLEVETTDSRTALIAKLGTVFTGSAITLPETQASHDMTGRPPLPIEDGDDSISPLAAALGAEPLEGGTGRADPRAIIQIDAQERDGVITKTDVSVGVNGKVWQLKRATPLDVPWRVVIALRNAVKDVITMNDEGEEVHVTALAYPFSVHEGPSRAEIAAWHAEVDDQLMPA